MNNGELTAWFRAMFIMVLLSVAVFAFQHFSRHFFNPAFEVCVFYIPTAILVIIYLRMKYLKGKDGKQT